MSTLVLLSFTFNWLCGWIPAKNRVSGESYVSKWTLQLFLDAPGMYMHVARHLTLPR